MSWIYVIGFLILVAIVFWCALYDGDYEDKKWGNK